VGWDWQHAGQRDEEAFTASGARDRTTGAITDAYTSYNRVLVEAFPTISKSYRNQGRRRHG
jgi:hypothetical protein